MRLTIRRSMILVAVCAVLFFVASEIPSCSRENMHSTYAAQASWACARLAHDLEQEAAAARQFAKTSARISAQTRDPESKVRLWNEARKWTRHAREMDRDARYNRDQARRWLTRVITTRQRDDLQWLEWRLDAHPSERPWFEQQIRQIRTQGAKP